VSVATRGLARVRLRGHSLRTQIVATLLVLLTLSFVAVATVTAAALHGYLLHQLDGQLSAAGNRYSLSLEHPDDHDADNDTPFGTVAGQSAGTLGARSVNGVVTAADVVAHNPDDQTGVSAADRQVLATLTPTNRPRTIQFPGLHEYRVLVTAGQDGDVLITGLPEHPVDAIITRLLLIETTVFAVALVVTGTIGALSVRWSLRPLRRVAATARAVSDLPLSTGTVSLPARQSVAAPQTEAGQVAVAFNHMLEHVEAALHDRHESEDRLRRFIADASHELRTPVSVVRSHAEYAQRVGSDQPDAVDEALARIVAESDRMGRLVEDLLLLARLDSGRPLAQEPVDLTRLVLDAVSDARVTGTDHTWRLELPESEVLLTGDGHALHQVVANLLTNAHTHTPRGTTVTTALTTTPDQVVIVVSDDGPGIAPDVLPHVFDRFVRADTARSRGDGSGLGLAIAAAIVAAHGGTITATADHDGTVLRVELRPVPEADLTNQPES
jgi:two-component system, OmpR family, sensor kinase